MWRVLVAGPLLAACSTPAPAGPDAAAPDVAAIDAASVLRTPPFTMQLCTGGNPGDPTCPENVIPLEALGQLAVGGQLRFVAQPLSQDLYITQLRITGNSHIHIVGLYVDTYANGMWTFGQLLTETLEPNTSVTAALTSFNSSAQIAFRVDRIY
ncbi:MAG TPA: hypothetical protein VL326_30330 [Kofleriaceae bacterium]|jgi:hypothetical protein|nr:hypothetical protein [Kofleriaceae bacterium]